MDKQVVENLSNAYLQKITDYYGYSKYHKITPYIVIEDSLYADGESKEVIAEYCSMYNDIIVYWKNIQNEEALIKTLIHEYQHYLQSPVWMQRYYKQGHDYVTHPYEVAARNEEQNWTKFLINRL
jgi:hypothetical protein